MMKVLIITMDLQYLQGDYSKDSILDFPIILHLRIKTKNRRAYDNMAESLFNILGDKLMDSDYSILKKMKTWGKTTGKLTKMVIK